MYSAKVHKQHYMYVFLTNSAFLQVALFQRRQHRSLALSNTTIVLRHHFKKKWCFWFSKEDRADVWWRESLSEGITIKSINLFERASVSTGNPGRVSNWPIESHKWKPPPSILPVQKYLLTKVPSAGAQKNPFEEFSLYFVLWYFYARHQSSFWKAIRLIYSAKIRDLPLPLFLSLMFFSLKTLR